MTKIFKTFLLVAILSLSLAISSFQKAPVNGRIKYSIVMAGGRMLDSSAATYDEKGRLTSVVGGLSKLEFKYTKDTVTQTMLSGKSVIYRISRKGLAAYDNLTNFYYYDANGFLVTKKRGSTVLQSNTIENGDIVNSLIMAGQKTIRNSYTFYPEPDLRDRGMTFLGKNNTHLVKTQINNIDGELDSLTYTYKFDELGRVKTETQSSKRSSLTTTYTYMD